MVQYDALELKPSNNRRQYYGGEDTLHLCLLPREGSITSSIDLSINLTLESYKCGGQF